jgi:hypothetical protein
MEIPYMVSPTLVKEDQSRASTEREKLLGTE